VLRAPFLYHYTTALLCNLSHNGGEEGHKAMLRSICLSCFLILSYLLDDSMHAAPLQMHSIEGSSTASYACILCYKWGYNAMSCDNMLKSFTIHIQTRISSRLDRTASRAEGVEGGEVWVRTDKRTCLNGSKPPGECKM